MPIYRIFNRSVSRDFRNLVAKTYPGLGNDPFLWKLCQYLLLTGEHHSEDGHEAEPVIVSQNIVWSLAEDRSHRRSSLSWLQYFTKATGIGLIIEGYDSINNRARTARASWTTEIKAALDVELATPASEKKDKVFFITGERSSRRRHKSEVDAHNDYLDKLFARLDSQDPVARLVNILKNADYGSKLIKRNLPAARSFVATTYSEGRKRTRINKILDFLDDADGRIDYKPGKKSRRLFAVGKSALCLPRGVRDILYGEAYKLDLASAHMAIAAANWGAPQLHEFLSGRNKLWEVLAKWCGVPFTDETKATLKPASYSVTYVAARNSIRKTIEFGDAKKKTMPLGYKAADQFLKHPFIVELLKARARIINRVKRDGGHDDAFHKWIKLEWEKDKDGKRKPQFGSLLSQVAQSYEMKIMLALVPILENNPQIRVIAWQHDGLTVALCNSSKATRWINQMTRAIDSICTELNIPTWLECNYLPVYNVSEALTKAA